MDILEAYILKNKDSLDVWEVPPALWQQITERLDDEAWERFVTAHREGFDNHVPPELIWEHIENALGKPSATLEASIRENRDLLDGEEAPTMLWDKISKSLAEEDVEAKGDKPVEKVIALRVLWRYAAVVALLIGCLLTAQHVYLTQDNEMEKEVASVKEDSPMNSLREAEAYYTSLISERKDQIKQYAVKQPELYADFQREIEVLDSMYREVKIEFYESQGSPQVMGALIENLQLRIDILNQQLNILEQIKNYENDTLRENKVEA